MLQRRLSYIVILLFGILLVASGCFQGMPSDKPPIDINPNMDNQPKYKAQEASAFFADGKTMRTPPPGTVARGHLDEDDAYYRGVDEDGKPIKKMPVAPTLQVLERGQERFNIYCSPCHSRVGNGKGIMISRGYVPPPSFHSDRLRNIEDGHIFDVITHGLRNMPSYAHQIPTADRWAIIAYLRALQRSQHAGLKDIPIEKRKSIQ
jgi:mono/diheme cytochrome c family protein